MLVIQCIIVSVQSAPGVDILYISACTSCEWLLGAPDHHLRHDLHLMMTLSCMPTCYVCQPANNVSNGSLLETVTPSSVTPYPVPAAQTRCRALPAHAFHQPHAAIDAHFTISMTVSKTVVATGTVLFVDNHGGPMQGSCGGSQPVWQILHRPDHSSRAGAPCKGVGHWRRCCWALCYWYCQEYGCCCQGF